MKTIPAATAVLFLLIGSVAYSQQLTSGQTVEFDIPGQSFVPSLFVNVGENRRLLSVEISADEDVDLLFLYEEEFPQTSNVNQLFAAADYSSGSATGEEFLAIGKYNNPPLRAGVWRIGILNFSTEETTVTLTTTLRNTQGPSQIDIDYNMSGPDCDTAPWFDTTPFTNQGGNNANTLGVARRQALEEAISIISENLISPVPLILRACWQDIEPEDGGVTLAFAGPDGRILQPGIQGLTEPGAWYPAPAGVRLAGTDTCNLFGQGAEDCNQPHLQATFNRLVDTNDALGGQRWWYGLAIEQNSISGPDFVSTAAHEILHGLGFISFVDVESGAKPQLTNGMSFDDVFSLKIEDYNGGAPRGFMDINNQQRASAIRSNTDLRWLGFEAVNSDLNPYANYQNGHPHLHAPAEVNPGSSLSHLTGEVFAGIPSFPAEELMRPVFLRPTRDLGLSQFIMWDVGWNPDAPQQLIIPELLLGNHYDRARDGHGFEFQRAGDTYFQLLYTYGDDGLPEFYVAAGTYEDGVFSADTMFRVVYDAANSPPQTPEPGSTGSSTIDFTVDASDATCDDGVDRSDALYLARWDWEIDDESGSWCIEPLRFAAGTPTPNYTGSWYAGPSDDGWGLSIFQQTNLTAKEVGVKGGNESVLSAILYYYDADGRGRWAIGSSDTFSAGNNVLNMIHVDGYCRDCQPSIGGAAAGTLELNLVDPSGAPGAGNTATVSVTYQGPGGGSWLRTDAPIQLLSTPAEQ